MQPTIAAKESDSPWCHRQNLSNAQTDRTWIVRETFVLFPVIGGLSWQFTNPCCYSIRQRSVSRNKNYIGIQWGEGKQKEKNKQKNKTKKKKLSHIPDQQLGIIYHHLEPIIGNWGHCYCSFCKNLIWFN